MTQPQGLTIRIPDPAHVAKTVVEIATKSQRLVGDFLGRQAAEGILDLELLAGIGQPFLEMTYRLMADPFKLAQVQISLWQDQVALWQQSAAVFWGQRVDPIITPAADDKRFKHDDWQDYFWFDFIKQSYLLIARWLQGVAGKVEGLDEHTQKKLDFYTRQFVDALAPTNFLFTNPEVLRATFESGGENLLTGLKHLLDDFERGKGRLKIRMTDSEAFTLGVNIATTPGKVIYQNTLIQLIQYDPSTAEVFEKPLLIVPPWINKFYIMDLRPKNSLIKWCVDQGFTVFVISWINPDEKLAATDFADYMMEGPLAALDAIEQATGEREVNTIGYCLGGTLSAVTAAYLADKGDDRLQSCTFLTTMLDFAHPGELEIFIDEDQLRYLETRMERRGYLAGGEMATTFSMLRANDLIWAFFINNYLLGKEPFPFDLLYWNADSTRMPAQMHSFYLRNMYQHNRLKDPGGITLAGCPIDLRKIRTPAYFLSAVEDHIAPWKSTYAGSRLLAGPVRFVLSGSGHIAGVINPPASHKYGYWVNVESGSEKPEDWMTNAERHDGSWWIDWTRWLSSHAGDKVPARLPGTGKLKVLEDAPGSFVRVRVG